MGNSLQKGSIENVESSVRKNIPIIINGIINLYYDCFAELDRKNNYKVKSFSDIRNFILMLTYSGDTIQRLSLLQKIYKKFINLDKSFEIIASKDISIAMLEYEVLCADFILSLREEIHNRLNRQFVEYNKSALNSLLYRIEDI